MTSAMFAEQSANILAQVFGMEMQMADVSCAPMVLRAEDRVVASVHFSGAYTGRLYLIMPQGQIREVIDSLLARYAIRTPVEDGAVFAEMINMIAAHLVTVMTPSGREINIAPPDADCLALRDNNTQQTSLTFTTPQAMRFTLRCEYTTTRKQTACL